MPHRLLILFCCLISTALWATQLTATVDRAQIRKGESFTLILTADSQKLAMPELKALKKDFQIFGVSETNELRRINGKTAAKRSWQITLFPKHTGHLTIPELHSEQITTQPIKIHVSKAVTKAHGSQKDAYLTVTAEPTQPYEQSQVIYTVKIYSAVRLQHATLTPPRADNMILEILGNDKKYQQTLHGRLYQVLERRYAIFPQASGRQTLLAPQLDGEVIRNQPYNTWPQLIKMAAGQPLQLTAKSIVLQVQPKPATIAGSHWLPARHLTINEAWSSSPRKLTIGQPITRTITLTATGLTPEQLPKLSPSNFPGMKVYLDKPLLKSHSTQNGLTSSRTEKIVMIPTRTETLTLPAISIPWWNTRTHQQQHAKLPAHRVSIHPGSSTTQAKHTPPATPVHAPTISPHIKTRASYYWPWVLTAAFLLLWILTLVAWRLKWGFFASTKKSAYRAIKAACLKQDPRATQRALLQWARLQQPTTVIYTLGDLLPMFPDAGQTVIKQLDQHLYTNPHAPWDGQSAWDTLQSLLHDKAQQHTQNTTGLPPLYPNENTTR